jgi:hypothetical protein
MSEHCGKEMQVFLERRRNYIRAKSGMAPANIIPLIWHSASDNIPKTLPKIHYQAPDLDANKYGLGFGRHGTDPGFRPKFALPSRATD